MSIKDRVEVLGVGSGWVARMGVDVRGDALIAVLLEDSSLTPDGMYLARSFELREA